MAIRFTDDTYYQEIADAIRAQLGTTLKISPPEMATEIGNIGGNDNLLQYLTGGLIDNTSIASASKIPAYGLYGARLKSMNFPFVTEIGKYGFFGANADDGTADFSAVMTIGDGAFEQDSTTLLKHYDGMGVEHITLPKCTRIGAYAFRNCGWYNYSSSVPQKHPLRSFSAPLCTQIQEYAFDRNNGSIISTLEEVNVPSATAFGEEAFRQQEAIKEFTTEAAITSMGTGVFQGCRGLKKFYAKNKTGILESTMFYDCRALEYADIGKTTRLYGSQTFYNCNALKALILRRDDAIATVDSTSIFNSSTIASSTGLILVPSALISTYETATNWATYAGQFRALEDYTVDGTITGDLDETKLENIA